MKDFKEELDLIRSQYGQPNAQRRKKLIRYVIRTLIAILLYVIFWDHKWVRWTLTGYIPLNLLGLLSIVAWNHILENRLQKIEDKMGDIDQETS